MVCTYDESTERVTVPPGPCFEIVEFLFIQQQEVYVCGFIANPVTR